MRFSTVIAAAVGVAIAVVRPDPLCAGAWVQADAGYYLKLAASYLYSETEFNYLGQKVPIRSGEPNVLDATYQDVSFTVYLEYGLTSKLTFVGMLPFKILTSEWTQADAIPLRRISVTNAGLSDLTLALRYPLVPSNRVPISFEGAVKVPLGYEAVPDNGGPALGSAKVDITGAVLAGASLYPLPAYVTGGIGYRVRGGELADEYLARAEAGLTPWKLLFKVSFEARISTVPPPNLAAEGLATSTSIAVNQDVYKLLPSLAFYMTDEVALVVEAYDIFAGKNTVAGTTWAVALSFEQ